MSARVCCGGSGHRLAGGDVEAGLVNRFLDHLGTRGFSPATVRAYAFDLANFLSFLAERNLSFDVVRPADLFGYLDWQRSVVDDRGRLRGVAASTMNRRVSTARSWFEYLVIVEVLGSSTWSGSGRRPGCG